MLKKWISDHFSDFTSKISSKEDYETIVQSQSEKDINKVILFTKKEKVTAVFKALSAEFRDRLRFAVIALPDGTSNADLLELKEDYEVEDMPKLILE